MTGLSNVYGPVGVNSTHWVQSKRKCESHESCVCIAGFSACGCQKKSVMHETEGRHIAVQKVSRTRLSYSTETHTSDFIFNTF